MDDALRQFMANIEATQQRDHADRRFISIYFKLAERTVIAETQARQTNTTAAKPTQPQTEKTPAPTAPSHSNVTDPSYAGFFSRRPASPRHATPPQANEAATLVQLRTQLASAQRARKDLEVKANDIPALHAANNAYGRQMATLEKEMQTLRRRLKDREDEIREKQKLSEGVQDEMVSLNLQLTMAEQQSEQLKKENKRLIDRWLKEMEQRADRLNKELEDI